MSVSRRTALTGIALPFLPRSARAAEAVRIGQANTALAFLPIWAARAYDSFPANVLALTWAAIPGGDPTTLAALDGGDIDLAAVGSDTALAAIAKGQPFTLVYDLMAKMSLELVVSDALLRRTGTDPDDPLPKRIAALKGAIVGVSAVGGAQDRTVRWMAAQGGLNPRTDLQVALVGGPPAIQAALENGRIEAFVLSPPEAGIAEAGGYGRRLIDPARDFPALAGLPNLVLAARREPDAATAARITPALAALTQAAREVSADPDAAADRIGTRFFPKVPPALLRTAVRSLLDGLAGGGRFTPESIAVLARFCTESGVPVPSEGDYWTNRFIPA